MNRQHALECPWCGRSVTLGRAGILPRHKRVTGTNPVTGSLERDWCPGGNELPFSLNAQQRAYLKTRWRDEGGELIGEES